MLDASEEETVVSCRGCHRLQSVASPATAIIACSSSLTHPGPRCERVSMKASNGAGSSGVANAAPVTETGSHTGCPRTNDAIRDTRSSRPRVSVGVCPRRSGSTGSASGSGPGAWPIQGRRRRSTRPRCAANVQCSSTRRRACSLVPESRPAGRRAGQTGGRGEGRIALFGGTIYRGSRQRDRGLSCSIARSPSASMP
jgi:hypothetical protein